MESAMTAKDLIAAAHELSQRLSEEEKRTLFRQAMEEAHRRTMDRENSMRVTQADLQRSYSI